MKGLSPSLGHKEFFLRIPKEIHTGALGLPNTTVDSLSLLQHYGKELDSLRKELQSFSTPVFFHQAYLWDIAFKPMRFLINGQHPGSTLAYSE